MTDNLEALSQAGVSIWLDDLSRERLVSGSLAGLAASTSVKDPAYPDTRYVTGLVAPGVVNTMPEATLRAVADHGQVPADSVRDHYGEARQVIDALRHIGIDFGDVMQGLEDDAVTKFDDAWQELGDQLATTLRDRQKGS